MNASATKRLTVSSGDSDRAAGGLRRLPPSHRQGSRRGRIDRPSRLSERGEPLSSSPMKEGLAPLLQTSSRGKGDPSLEPSHGKEATVPSPSFPNPSSSPGPRLWLGATLARAAPPEAGSRVGQISSPCDRPRFFPAFEENRISCRAGSRNAALLAAWAQKWGGFLP